MHVPFGLKMHNQIIKKCIEIRVHSHQPNVVTIGTTLHEKNSNVEHMSGPNKLSI